MIRFVRCKEFTSFWGMEVNHILEGKQIPLWTNPTVGARLGEKVRFHVIGLGATFHTFLQGTAGLERGTTSVIDTANLGPIDRQSFVVEAGESAWGSVNGPTESIREHQQERVVLVTPNPSPGHAEIARRGSSP